jgi:hypothetical protein
LDDPEKMREYRVIYLADVAHLSKTRVDNIRQFVREGGGLVATYGTSLFDSAGRRQNRFALEELLRAAPVEPSAELSQLLTNYRSMTGGPYDLYFAGRPSGSFEEITPLWWFEPVKALEGGDVWKDIVTGDGLRAILPGVIVSRSGKGKVVYCASGLESLFLQANQRAVGDLLAALVTTAGGPTPYEINAPEALIANLTVKGNVRVLHLTNWAGTKLERPGANDYYLAPVENVKIRFHLPNRKKVRKVSLLVDAQYGTNQEGSFLEVTIPRVEAYQAVRLEFE